MDRGPLVDEEIEVGAELISQFDKIQPVKVAFWLKADDEEQRYLYIASDQINGANIRAAYGEVSRLAKKINSRHLNLFRVKLINANNPLAKAAADINSRFPNRLASSFAPGSFGGMGVDDVFIYEPLTPAVAI